MTHGVQSPLLHAPIYPFPRFYSSNLCRESHDWSKNGCGLFFILTVFKRIKWFNISIYKVDGVTPEWSCLRVWCHVVEGHPGWPWPLKGFFMSPWMGWEVASLDLQVLPCITYWKKMSSAEGFPGGTSGDEPACQCKRQEMRVWSLGREDPLEEGMASHSSILAWKIPWTEVPGRLQSMGSQRAGHNWSNLTPTSTAEYSRAV